MSVVNYRDKKGLLLMLYDEVRMINNSDTAVVRAGTLYGLCDVLTGELVIPIIYERFIRISIGIVFENDRAKDNLIYNTKTKEKIYIHSTMYKASNVQGLVLLTAHSGLTIIFNRDTGEVLYNKYSEYAGYSGLLQREYNNIHIKVERQNTVVVATTLEKKIMTLTDYLRSRYKRLYIEPESCMAVGLTPDNKAHFLSKYGSIKEIRDKSYIVHSKKVYIPLDFREFSRWSRENM